MQNNKNITIFEQVNGSQDKEPNHHSSRSPNTCTESVSTPGSQSNSIVFGVSSKSLKFYRDKEGNLYSISRRLFLFKIFAETSFIVTASDYPLVTMIDDLENHNPNYAEQLLMEVINENNSC